MSTSQFRTYDFSRMNENNLSSELNELLISLTVNKSVVGIKNYSAQIDNQKIKHKVDRFVRRFEEILHQEMRLIGVTNYSGSFSLQIEEDHVELSWTQVSRGAGFIFDEIEASWYVVKNNEERMESSSGTLTEENCAKRVREVIRQLLR